MDVAKSVTATFVDPCEFRPLTLGTTFNGMLTPQSCNLVSVREDWFTYTVAQQTTFRATMNHPGAAGFVAPIVPPAGGFWSNSSVTGTMVMVAPGSYLMVAGINAGLPGNYSLTTALNPPANCEPVINTTNITTNGTLLGTPACSAYQPSGLVGSFTGRGFFMHLLAGQTITARLTSTAFSPVLELRALGATGALLRSTVPDPASSTAVLTYTSPTAQPVSLWVTSRVAAQIGAYTLIIDP
jgi:hypothetical protein